MHRLSTRRAARDIQLWLTISGVVLLVAGSMVYPLFREGPSLLVPSSGAALANGSSLVGAFPSFAHAFGFTALLLATLWHNRRLAVVACGAWLAVTLVLEMIQRLSVVSVNRISRVFAGGTFDAADLAAAVAGVGAAALLGWLLHRWRNSHDVA